MRPIITSDRPKISRLYLAGAGRQDLGGGLINEQPCARQEVGFHPVGKAAEPGGGSTRPVAHGSPIDLYALTPQRLCLPIEGHVIDIFPDQNIGDQRLGGQAAWHHMPGRRRLEHAIAARPTRHFRTRRHDHAILDGDHIKSARYVAVYAVQRAYTAGTFLLVWKDHFLNADQVRGQRSRLLASIFSLLAILIHREEHSYVESICGYWPELCTSAASTPHNHGRPIIPEVDRLCRDHHLERPWRNDHPDRLTAVRTRAI